VAKLRGPALYLAIALAVAILFNGIFWLIYRLLQRV